MASKIVFSHDHVPEIMREIYTKTRQRSLRIGNLIRKKIAEGFSSKKSGLIYKLPDGKVYRASAPGEYPAIKYGPLSSTFKVAVSKGGQEIIVTSGTDYGAELEGGSEYNKMAFRDSKESFVDKRGRPEFKQGSRPWASKAYYEVRADIMGILDEDWKLGSSLPK